MWLGALIILDSGELWWSVASGSGLAVILSDSLWVPW